MEGHFKNVYSLFKGARLKRGPRKVSKKSLKCLYLRYLVRLGAPKLILVFSHFQQFILKANSVDFLVRPNLWFLRKYAYFLRSLLPEPEYAPVATRINMLCHSSKFDATKRCVRNKMAFSIFGCPDHKIEIPILVLPSRYRACRCQMKMKEGGGEGGVKKENFQ